MDARTNHHRARALFTAVTCALAVACGGRSESSTTSPDASVVPTSPSGFLDAGSRPDAAPSPFDAGTIGSLLVDSGMDSSAQLPQCDAGGIGAEFPVNHRPSGSTCPARAAGNIGGCTYDGGVACVMDSDCTSGSNGRCLQYRLITQIPQIPPPPPGCQPPECSYDECESDTDCPSGVPCNCRGSSVSSAPNICATGSNCRTDSDCPGNFCSPGGYADGTCSEPTFFCHTPADTCINDSDCCGGAMRCVFDKTLGHFACGMGCVPPP